MFTEFFYTLRRRKVPVSLTEWMTLMETLSKGCIASLDEFYYLARAVLIKSESYYDDYDLAFQEYFQGVEFPLEIPDDLKEWLKDVLERMELSEEDKARLRKLSYEELLKELEKRLKEQTEQHDGGSYWIGRGGTSPFGHSGINPMGIRIGGEGGGRSAVKIAMERRFRNYRADLTLDTRQVKMALKRLRRLKRIGAEDELDLEQTVDATAKNYGDLELRWRRNRKNAAKLLLLMDVGGSMEPFALLCSQLFSAAHSSTHFKDFQYYYFHNCVYKRLYKDIERRDAISTEHLLHTLDADYKVMLVGDASMGDVELMAPHGSINYYETDDETPGVVWLRRLSQHFKHCVWLNPEAARYWVHPTVNMISRIFPMYPLTLDGLGEGVKKLLVKR